MSNDFKVACVIPLGPSGANWENPNKKRYLHICDYKDK
jgi:hypothetical protein